MRQGVTIMEMDMLDYQLTNHNAHCPKCKVHLTSLLLCPKCGIRYEWSMVLGEEVARIAKRDGVPLPDGISHYIGRAIDEAQNNLLDEPLA